MSEKVSVIVPVYNVAEYLENCIHSILKQTYSNLELILIDDGSTDQSLEICRKYHQMDNRVKIISQNNGGVSATRNIGLSVTTSSLFMFVDSDDWLADSHILVANVNEFDTTSNNYVLYNHDSSVVPTISYS